jgi:hypothetical protein
MTLRSKGIAAGISNVNSLLHCVVCSCRDQETRNHAIEDDRVLE